MDTSIPALTNRTPNSQRADYLQEILNRKDSLPFSDLWPNLKALVTWTSGNCAVLLPALEKLLPAKAKIVEMGYLASEFRGTITIDCLRNLGAPTIEDIFFEFIEKEDWHSGQREAKTIDQLEAGKHYYIIVTTPNGLYRYFINDLIEVTGAFINTPTIRFVQKGSGVTSLSGEKIYETQVIEAVTLSCKHLGIHPGYYILLANRDDFSYSLFFDAKNLDSVVEFEQEFNLRLAELNMEFRDKVKSGRIRKVTVRAIKPGVYEAYKDHLVRAGQREGQFKMTRLQYRDDCTFRFEDYLL